MGSEHPEACGGLRIEADGGFHWEKGSISVPPVRYITVAAAVNERRAVLMNLSRCVRRSSPRHPERLGAVSPIHQGQSVLFIIAFQPYAFLCLYGSLGPACRTRRCLGQCCRTRS
uniref:Uncharacterized protein n=1 Tax=Knipowitschia caucasica TaxID=637954 RepID=A0AAV2M0B4_KNICA